MKAENELPEWVRDIILDRNFEKLNSYFPPAESEGITDKIKRVSKELYNNGLLKTSTEFDHKF